MKIKDSFWYYWFDYHVFGFVKYVLQEPRFWMGFGAGGFFMIGVNAL